MMPHAGGGALAVALRQPRGATMTEPKADWPDLAGLALQPTIGTLHLWSQVVGKVRLRMTPWENHSWHVPLYVSARGLTTDFVPAGPKALAIDFDLLTDRLLLCDTDGGAEEVALRDQSVAAFFEATMAALSALGIDLRIDRMPNEIPDAVPFHLDTALRGYDGAVARSYWRALVRVQNVLQRFRTRFVGKCSPIHLFWGSFDLAVTRFSGRPAPRHPGGAVHMSDAVAREAYSHEVSSAGFWPGGGGVSEPSFYSYAYPAPAGFSQAAVGPAAAFFDATLGEFLLPYSAVRSSDDPEAALLDFLQSTYEAAANLAHWDRQALERPTGALGHPPAGS
jgi:hypothetical protein